MRLSLAYGRGHLDVDFPDDRTTVIEPSHVPRVPDERGTFLAALEQPIGCRPLRTLVRKDSRVCIAFTDITRATPNHKIIPWLLEFLAPLVPRENIVLLNQLGTHRPNTKAELEQMLTPDVVANYRVVNHEPENEAEMVQFGVTGDGTPALINRHIAEADLRIITGFIEPHFFAGFSGGPKGIMPGCAALRTVMSNHGTRNIGSPKATFGINEGNPLWEELRDIALRVGFSFVCNVTLNHQRGITGVFAGDLVQAHRVGTAFVKKSAMQRVDAPFDIVVTTNSGYPLDMNLYQGVKGLSAASRIVANQGTVILVAELSEGVPANSPFDELLRSVSGPEELLARLATPGFSRPEQWQAQIQALIQRRARVLVHGGLSEDRLRACHLEPCADVGGEVKRRLQALGPRARVAVLPQGPLTIPYLG
jgi:nickel-dependent lactate racemase